MLADVLATDRPLLVRHQQQFFVPFLVDYPETAFGGDFPTPADYQDPFVQQLIADNGWAIWPLIPFHFDTPDRDLDHPAPSPPTKRHWLGTDDQSRDVMARLLHGFRLSTVFGLLLAIFTSLIGVVVGLMQGYFGGRIDLIGQRLIELWGAIPQLYVLLIIASIIVPGFFTLLFILVLFGWTGLVGVIRAETLKVRQYDYVKAARVLGASHWRVMRVHVLPNALVSTLTLMPFILAGSLVALTSLDFLGFGLPPGSPSLGEVLNQGYRNLQAPWLGISSFAITSAILILMVFIGEGVRDAFDPNLAKVSEA
ncbi:MAG: ABC transporter permease [Alphaproteobacteria bacterium]|nr:ABC transporter permease [Alphaproteobacteria bacterium]